MAFLLFAILFGLAAAYGYYLDKQNEDFQNRWICTGRSALAGSSFAMLFCFVLWLFFKQAEAALGKRNEAAALPTLTSDTRIDLPSGETVKLSDSPTLTRDTIFKLQTRYRSASLFNAYPDSIVWLRQRQGEHVRYRIAVSRGKQIRVLCLPAEEVTFLPDHRGEVIEQGYWSLHKNWWGARRLKQDSVRYLVSLPERVAWWDFEAVNP